MTNAFLFIFCFISTKHIYTLFEALQLRQQRPRVFFLTVSHSLATHVVIDLSMYGVKNSLDKIQMKQRTNRELV